MQLKKFFKRVISGGYDLTDYIPVGLSQIDTKAFLTNKLNAALDVTFQHFVLAYNPLMIGVVLPKECIKSFSPRADLCIYGPDKVRVSILHLKFYREVDAGDENNALILFGVQGASVTQLNWFRRNAILWWRYFQNRAAGKYFNTLSFTLHLQYAAAFSFPRKVGLATVKVDEAFKTFPIDLHGRIGGTDQYVWGIRHSNTANASILSTKRIVIADVPYTQYRSIYVLGKFKPADHSPEAKSIETEMWNYQAPAFISGYKEIELLHSEDIGSQRLFLGKIISEKRVNTDTGELLYHVHFLQFLQAPHAYPKHI